MAKLSGKIHKLCIGCIVKVVNLPGWGLIDLEAGFSVGIPPIV